MFKFLYRFKYFDGTDETNKKIEASMESGIKRIRSIDPETEIQWKRLKNILLARQTTDHNRFIIPKGILFKPTFSLAIAGVIIIIAGVIWMRYSSINTYKTTKCQHSEIKLQDSTDVMLNYMSELKVGRWSPEKARYVELKGEALFHVRRKGTPFIITTDVGTVQVLGTQFNVRVRDNKMEVAVLEGSVKVSINKNGKDSSIVLSKNQIVICEKNNFPDVPKPIPFIEYPGWIQGKFMFYKTSFFSVCKELELQFDVVIRIENTRQQNLTITGIVNGQNVEGALATLTQLTGSKYSYEDGGYVIY